MATVKTELDVWGDVGHATNYPIKSLVVGTNFSIRTLSFDQSTIQTTYFSFQAINYGSSSITCKISWYANGVTTGDVVWSAALAAITANTDTESIISKAFATANTVTDSHLGTTATRLHEAVITISNLDSLATGDWCVLKVFRDASNGSDTMAATAYVVGISLEWSDT